MEGQKIEVYVKLDRTLWCSHRKGNGISRYFRISEKKLSIHYRECSICHKKTIRYKNYRLAEEAFICLNPKELPLIRKTYDKERELEKISTLSPTISPVKTLSAIKQDVHRQSVKVVNYCMCELMDVRTHKSRIYIVSNSAENPFVCKGEENVVFGTEMATQCLRATANNLRSISANKRRYKVIRSVCYDPEFVDRFIEREQKTQPVPAEAKKVEISIPSQKKSDGYSDETIYVYYRLNNKCTTQNHPVDSVTLKGMGVGKSTALKLNVFYCNQCKRYFINYESLKPYIAKRTVPSFKYEIVSNNNFERNPVSKLKIYGYSADASTKIGQRQGVLAWIIDNELMSKNEIILNLQSFISFNGKKESNANAKTRWEEDLEYVSHYVKGNKKSIYGSFRRS